MYFAFNFDVIFENSSTICPFLPNLRVKDMEVSKSHMKMNFDACSENDIIHDVIIFGHDWQLKSNTNNTPWYQILGLKFFWNNCKINKHYAKY